MRKSALFFFGLVVTALVALGLVVLSSASEANAMRLHNGDNLFFMKRQFIYLVGGLVIAVCAAAFDYRRWRENWFLTAVFYGVVLVLLLLVFRYPAINGSQRWIDLGFIRLQPSEFAKLVTVVSVAVWLDKAGWRVELFGRGALMSAVLIGGLALPVLVEPDFGSVMVIACAGGLVMIMAGVRILHMAPFLALGAAVFIYKVATNANRMARLAAFVGVSVAGSPSAAPETADGASSARPPAVLTAEEAAIRRADYQVNQALVAIHNGGVWGVGFGESMQKQLYLPEAHTDFVFAIGAEELGIVFSVVVVVLFMSFFGFAVYIARKAPDRLGRFLATGMAFLVFFQAMFNLGVVCKALPTKGMALPFFSYGGTNLLSSFFAVGTILSVGIHSYRDRKRRLPHKVLARG
ncbi:MAG: FtsW/RodA/SpoVE family cell cycle protein [Kiritimatiellia bacterium]